MNIEINENLPSSKRAQIKYRKQHPEKVSELNKRAYNKMKDEQPEKYQLLLEARREKYRLKKLNLSKIYI